MESALIQRIFSEGVINQDTILKVFNFQYSQNKVYREWCNYNGVTNENVQLVEDIPFLPISFFKTHQVVSGKFEPELIFESSGTTETTNSRHYVKHADLYKKSFISCFENFYGNIENYCILGLLPNYLERRNSSLVNMTNTLITLSQHEDSGYFLYDFEALASLLLKLEQQKQKTILFGVTFALIDFVEKFSFQLNNTIIMDTGGMKGRKTEMTRVEVHSLFKKRFGVDYIHSEYGMTELLSQAYSMGEGLFRCPPWMKVKVREESDPLAVNEEGRGLLNVIDLANLYSCSFIATDDVGVIKGEQFEVWGRRDHSDLRGCSLMVV